MPRPPSPPPTRKRSSPSSAPRTCSAGWSGGVEPHRITAQQYNVLRILPVAPSAKKDVYDVTGDFTMHGVTKQITVPVEVLGWQNAPQAERVGFGFSTKLNRKDYGVTWNRTLDNNVMLGDDIDIDVSIEAVKKKEGPPAADAAPAPKR